MAIETTPATSGWSQSAEPVRWWSPRAGAASGSHGRGFQPPRKRSDEHGRSRRSCWQYSATKKSDHLKAPYSVWKPPTRSASDSGMSKGWRFVSANSATRKMKAESGIVKRNHVPPQNPGSALELHDPGKAERARATRARSPRGRRAARRASSRARRRSAAPRRARRRGTGTSSSRPSRRGSANRCRARPPRTPPGSRRPRSRA